jgi:hypothetical protein
VVPPRIVRALEPDRHGKELRLPRKPLRERLFSHRNASGKKDRKRRDENMPNVHPFLLICLSIAEPTDRRRGLAIGDGHAEMVPQPWAKIDFRPYEGSTRNRAEASVAQ